jgi:hypothetical protein
MNNGFPVIDADRHIMEPSDLWDRYLEPASRGARYSAFGRHVACHTLEQMLAALTLAADGCWSHSLN